MFGVDKSILFFFKAALFGISTIVVIPKSVYKKFVIYGLYFGAVIDVILIAVLEKFHIIKYYNLGPFSILGYFSFWTPISWMFAVMLFLYFLPQKRIFFYAYIPTFAIFGVMIGIILKNFGFYQLNIPVLFLVILTWFSLIALAYLYLEKIELEPKKSRVKSAKYVLAPSPESKKKKTH